MSFAADLEERRDLGHGLALFRFVPEVALSFEAGQHTTLGLAGPDGTRISRPLSIASAPSDRALEFLVRRQSRRDDAFVESLFALQEGARVQLGPRFDGEVTLERTVGLDDPRVRVLVAAGTGIAPFLSMVRAHGDDGRTVVLHGARAPGEFAAHEVFEGILGERYIPVLSGGDPAWRGFRGRVETMFDGGRVDAVERVVGLAPGELGPARAVVFVCGFRETIARTVRRLLPRGFVPDGAPARRALGVPADVAPTIFFEYYESEPLFGNLP